MLLGRKHRRRFGGGALLLSLFAALGPGVVPAEASGPPLIGEVWASAVFATSARLQAKVNPNGLTTTYHFDYIAKAAYDANVGAAKDPFTGASHTPPASDVSIGSGTAAISVLQLLSGLQAETTYYYRLMVKNSASFPNYVDGPALFFNTQGTGGSSPLLPDARGWEMVSPIEKNGGQVGAPGTIAGGGVLQAAAAGGSVAYSSETSFGSGGQGAPGASQYIGTRGAGWSTQGIDPPSISGGYHSQNAGVPYQVFSPDLARALLFNGDHCRGEGTGCAVANPPLTGTDAPAGYQNYYLRENATGGVQALLGAANAGFLTLGPDHFDLSLAGTAADLTYGVVSTCAALTAAASEVPLGEGCDPAKQNLYEYSPGGGLSLVNTVPGAALAAQSGAVSADGGRVYWKNANDGNLYLREGALVKQVDAAAGGGGSFQTASVDGAVAYYTQGGHLWRYEPAGSTSTDLTPSGGVQGVLGASAAGSFVYYATASGIFLRNGGATTPVASSVDAADYPPATGTARVSADGSRLLFVSTQPLTAYDNKDLNTGNLDSQVYLYDASGGGSLTCVSCNPTNGRPVGPSNIPGAIANGTAPGSTDSYKPRVLSSDGRRVFFDSSDALVLTDTNGDQDAYEWEAQGEGSCSRTGGCVSLISGGRSATASFVDASADGADAFFLTEASLVDSDPGALDLYDARVGGGFLVETPPIPCEGDACQSLPPQPIDPTLTTTIPGLGNPGVSYPGNKHCKKSFVKRKGKCVRKGGRRRQERHGKRGAR